MEVELYKRNSKRRRSSGNNGKREREAYEQELAKLRREIATIAAKQASGNGASKDPLSKLMRRLSKLKFNPKTMMGGFFNSTIKKQKSSKHSKKKLKTNSKSKSRKYKQ